MADQDQIQFRISTESGHRQYLCNGKRLPSVTTVLSNTETEKSKKALAQWIKNNPDQSGKAAIRGTAIHEACENFIRGKPIDIPEEYAAFWNGMDEYLAWFDHIIWSERPLLPEWQHLKTPDGDLAFVWSEEHGYAGTPDLLGTIGGVNVIADYKTSNGPYRTSFPKRGDRQGFGGYRKFQKVSQQLAAYRLAMAERTGWKADVGLVIVSTEETTQGIFIDTHQMDLAESRFLRRCEQYHALYTDNDFEAKGLS